MTTSTMTTREFLNAVINGNVDASCVEKATEMLSALDAKNEKRKSVESKEKKEATARRESVLAFIKGSESPVTRDVIAEALGITPSQASSACSVLVRQEVLLKDEIKIGKSRKTAYTLAV